MASTPAWRLTRVEMVTMRPIPAAWARATTASSSPAKSGKSRWQWLSINMVSMPQVGPGDARELRFEFGDLARQIFQDPLAQRRIRAERHFRDGLGQRRNDLVHVDGILLAAR